MIAFLTLGVFRWGRMTERRLIGLLATVLGLIAGPLMLSAAVGHASDLIGIVAAVGVLYGSYLIFREKLSLLFAGRRREWERSSTLQSESRPFSSPEASAERRPSSQSRVASWAWLPHSTAGDPRPSDERGQPKVFLSSTTVADIESRTPFR